MSKQPIQAILIGAGQRGADAYAPYALQHPDELQFVAVAEPDPSPEFATRAPWPGRFESIEKPPASRWSRVAFAYAPTARVHHAWQGRAPLSTLVRLRRRPGEESIHPVVLDRVWNGLQQVRPAGVRVALAVDETIVRGVST